MTIRQWFAEYGPGEPFIGAEGRGYVYLERVTQNTFCALLSKQGAECVFHGDEDADQVAEWFADQVCFSEGDRVEMLSRWRGNLTQG
jgi:hypothetical protein